MSRLLLTGATGLIGAELIPLLRRAGHEVHAVSARSGPADGAPGGASSGEATAWHRCNLRDGAATRALVADVGPELLVHLAWSRPGSAHEEEDEGWVTAGVELWDAFAAGGGRRALVAGTSAEYEWSRPLLGEDSPVLPGSAYGRAKASLHERLRERSDRDGVALAWPRLFWAYGAEPDSPRLVPSVARALVEGRPVATTDGLQVRDYIHASDAASALAAILEAEIDGPVNVGSGEGTPVVELLRTLERLGGREGEHLIEIGAIPRRPGDPPELVADVSRLRGIGWQPATDLDAGLAATLERTRELLG